MAPRIVHDALRSSGNALEERIRAPFESALGENFGHVRVHTDAQASASARAVHALAYTVGQHVVFREGTFDPWSDRGRRLLAHELTHVTQQSPITAPPGDLPVAGSDSAAERSAAAAEPVLARAAEDSAFEPADFGSTVPASALGPPCGSDDNEHFPLLMRGDHRAAVGFAQKRLNDHLDQIKLCLAGPCPSLPELNKQFILDQFLKFTEYPLTVDCNFGPNTAVATKILQAFWLMKSAEWDGKIGPNTWALVMLDAVTHQHPPAPPLPPPGPLSPRPFPAPTLPGPITL